MANPQQGIINDGIPDTFALRAELIPHDDDVVSSRHTVQKLLQQETVGLWARQVLEDVTNNWLFRIVWRVEAVRKGTQKHCLVACGGGNDILVLINTTEMPPPPNFRDIPKIGVDVCLASGGGGRNGVPLDRTDPMNVYGCLGGSDVLRNHVRSERAATGATEFRLFLDTGGEDTFVDVTQGSIEDKRVLRFTVRSSSSNVEGDGRADGDWQVESVVREAAVEETFFPSSSASRNAAVAPAAAPLQHAPPPARRDHHQQQQEEQPSRQEEEAENPASDDESLKDVAAASAVAAAPKKEEKKKKRKKTKSNEPTAKKQKSKSDGQAGDKSTEKKKRAPSRCVWKFASECGGHSKSGCKDYNDGLVVVPEGVDLKKEKRKAKKELADKESKEKAKQKNESDTTEDKDEDNTADKDVAEKETPKESGNGKAPASNKSKASPQKKSEARDAESVSLLFEESASESSESNEKPAAAKKRKESESEDDENDETSTVENSSSTKKPKKKKSKVDNREGAESAKKKRAPALCYYYPFCQKHASECGGHNKTGCKDYNEGRVVVPEGVDLKQEKRKAKKKLEKEKEKAKKLSGDDGTDAAAQKDATNAEEDDAAKEDSSPAVTVPDFSDEALEEVAKSSEALCFYFPFCTSLAKECGGTHRDVCKEVRTGRVVLPPEKEFEATKKKAKTRVKYLRRKLHKAAKEKEQAAAKTSDGDDGNRSDDSTVTEQQSPNRPARSSSKKSSGDDDVAAAKSPKSKSNKSKSPGKSKSSTKKKTRKELG